MVKFGKVLEKNRHAPWAPYYLDYNYLKAVLADGASTTVFAESLRNSVEKVSLFFLERQGELARRVLQARSGGSEGTADLCEELLCLIEFLQLNALAVRKIVKKHDKGALAPADLVATAGSHLLNLAGHNGLGALLDSLESLAGERQEHKEVLAKLRYYHENLTPSVRFSLFLSSRALLFDPDPWAGFEQRRQDGEADEERAKGPPRVKLSTAVWLNLISFFLFNTNLYICVPTISKYTKALYVEPAFSGLILGWAAAAQIISNVGYSIWSNRSFRLPIAFSSCLLVLANLATALALPFESVALLCLGRFLLGAGGCEAVNRRHIADTVSKQDRTQASAAFVAAGAMGMATGPIFAAILKPLNTAIYGLPVNKLTAPGWFMAVIWAVYLVVMWAFFVDPTHRAGYGVCGLLDSREIERNGEGVEEDPALQGEEDLRLLSTPSPSYGAMIKQENGHVPILERLPSVERQQSDETWTDEKPSIVRALLQRPALLYALLVYALVELVDEVLLSSTSYVTDAYFDWKIHQVGIFIGVLGATVLPVNFVVGRLSAICEDRTMLMVSLCAATGGLLCILSYNSFPPTRPYYSSFQFGTGAAITFISVAVMEGVDTSLMSKVIPASLAMGTFNSGLLATQVGTIGRVLGDLLITGIGLWAPSHPTEFGMEGSPAIVDGLFVPLLLANAVVLVIGLLMYKGLRT